MCYRYILIMFNYLMYLLALMHFTALGLLLLYGMHRLWFVALWYRERKRCKSSPVDTMIKGDHRPFVTVQLPIYNERFVAARLIDATAKLVWPREQLEIQILDDSDDDTVGIVDDLAEYWSQKEITMKVLRRKQRTGYKAGALNFGLKSCSGEYIAIFDADFIPPEDFLQKTIPYFEDKQIGMVQARWDFLNVKQSWLTKIQAILLGAHFSIEHWVRFKRGMYFNFNGTAGVWRKKTIISAGGWEDDTVTEDLDLSYRAQLAGWKFVYLDDLPVPSELPSSIASFRSQQQRWAKGSIQTARKMLPKIIQSSVPINIKIEAGFHLLSNLGWLFGMIITLTLFPTIVLRTHIGPYQMIRIDLPLFMGASCAVLFFFFISLYKRKNHELLPCLVLLPVFSIAIAPSIALSVINGVFNWGGIFERTPKFGIRGSRRLPSLAFIYVNNRVSFILLNIVLFFYSLIPFFYAFNRETWFALPLLGLFPVGFLMIIIKELSEVRINFL
jgi:cellulose synthase/poly-beta-1,6-N-acetylglucosamine synthase-like glycosyltransferase